MGIDKIRLELGMQARTRDEALRIGALPPAIVMHGHMHGLAGIADKMRPYAQITQRQQLPHLFGVRIAALFGLGEGEFPRIFLRRDIQAKQRKVLYQLLPAIHQIVRQVAGLVFVTAHGAQSRVVGFAAGRQVGQSGPAKDRAVIGQIQEMARIKIGVMRLA